MPFDEDEGNKQVRDHAWEWFVLHAGQRMQTFNFFLVATAFLIAGYGSLLKDHPGASVGIALVGAWIAFWFQRLDRRTRQLVNAGESALKKAQERLARCTNMEEVKILESVERPARGASSYRHFIEVIQWTVVSVFLLAAVYAAW